MLGRWALITKLATEGELSSLPRRIKASTLWAATARTGRFPIYGYASVSSMRRISPKCRSVHVFRFFSSHSSQTARIGALPSLICADRTSCRVWDSRRYGKAWRAGQRYLIPARWIYEPCYETGRNFWQRIGLTDWQSYCVAGI